MTIRRQSVWLATLLAGVMLVACTWITPTPQTVETAPRPAADCPVTLPNGRVPIGESPSPSHHGNDAIITALWPGGVVLIPPDMVMEDGELSMKWPWWRAVTGQLSISGRRQDAPAPPLRSHLPDGYGDSGFQATGLIFPTEGCWEVTGSVGDHSLTFVTWVQPEQAAD